MRVKPVGTNFFLTCGLQHFCYFSGLVTQSTEQLHNTLETITECLEVTGSELTTILEDLQYHKGTEC